VVKLAMANLLHLSRMPLDRKMLVSRC